MHGWRELVALVARAMHAAPTTERTHTVGLRARQWHTSAGYPSHESAWVHSIAARRRRTRNPH